MLQQVPKNNTPQILTAGKARGYHLNRDVILSLQDDIAQILDFHRGQFYGLDSMATLMLCLVLEKVADFGYDFHI